MAKVDLSQGFYGWNLDSTSDQVEPENDNDIPYPDGSYEHRFWNLYRQLYIPICQHASDGNIVALLWHVRTLKLLLEQVQELVARIEADADKENDK